MPDSLLPDSNISLEADRLDEIRQFDRSPHPYAYQGSELPWLNDRGVGTGQARGAHSSKHRDGNSKNSANGYPFFSKESTPASDSGTEADDEHYLKGLPAPRARLHKGLRGANEPISGATTPLASSAFFEHTAHQGVNGDDAASKEKGEKQKSLERSKRKRVLVRRATEVGILTTLAWLVFTSESVDLPLGIRKGLQSTLLLVTGLVVLCPVRLVVWAYCRALTSKRVPIRFPVSFDPAPLLYPPAITVLVAILVGQGDAQQVLPNVVLALATIPEVLIPSFDSPSYNSAHWAVTCLPLASIVQDGSSLEASVWDAETLTWLYPLHVSLCAVLYQMTGTSLLTTELQLFSVAMLNVLLLAQSPQMQILRGLLWAGGLSIILLCSSAIRWGIMLARVPRWRLLKTKAHKSRSPWSRLIRALPFSGPRKQTPSFSYGTEPDVDSSEGESPLANGLYKAQTMDFARTSQASRVRSASSPVTFGQELARRHTASTDASSPRKPTHTPSGRPKRATSASWRPFLRLSNRQAELRKWLCAAYVYATIPLIILTAVRFHVQRFALGGREPIGWALSYLFGNLPWFRFQVVNANLESWIPLPTNAPDPATQECHLGWVQHIRHDSFGEANTRLLLSAYWLGVVIFGLLIVFRLSDTYEVDTRRKVFHFTMVGMFLPTVFVDPTYAALALSLVLAIFLILDLLRASQLPPLSKPLASFLAPYVDGRDFRGPVVISHIFLLIGCAIPLWLSLAALPRSELPPGSALQGWEVPTRDVSMVSGVVCVGLGDAAASLIGRRYGRRKWIWGGGKSLEGSVSFAAAVFAGLFTASLWLRAGGWPPSAASETGMMITAGQSAFCASLASVTEAALTGGNDNVVVPVVLWTCVKSLGM